MGFDKLVTRRLLLRKHSRHVLLRHWLWESTREDACWHQGRFHLSRQLRLQLRRKMSSLLLQRLLKLFLHVLQRLGLDALLSPYQLRLLSMYLMLFL